MKDHQVAQLINELTDTARKYANTQQLRERIATIVKDTLEEHNVINNNKQQNSQG